jgi:fatty-acyl-CoA synthase
LGDGGQSLGTFARIRANLSALNNAGLLNPGFVLALAKANKRWGPTLATGVSAAAARWPNDVALTDDLGKLTFREVDERSNALASSLSQGGLKEGDSVAILCRNHRGFVESTAAVNKIGAHALFLNTGFAAPQLVEVVEREGAHCVIYDEEFAAIVEPNLPEVRKILAWHDDAGDRTTLDALIMRGSRAVPSAPTKPGRATILTSGTTGTPKGAQREPKSLSLDTTAGVLERMPLRLGDTFLIAAPTFHAWGLSQLQAAATIGGRLVLQRRFDPEATLCAIAEHRATVLVVVPVMMQRILALDPDVIAQYDTSSLRVVGASGSALPGELALRWMDAFGDNLYNFYGSTEVAQTSIANPRDLRAAPGTAGKPPRGTVVKIFDWEGREVPAGTTGRIFVGNEAQFEGYTGGGDKERIQGLMSIGDLGHFDEGGRLFVEGRDDDMIVSGGENVFPIEVENLLSDHEDVYEAAVIGVPDEEFGQRLKAFVVTKPGRVLTEDAVKGYVRANLARYKIPREVVFLDELPRNPTGKILKRVLRDHR